MSVWFYFDEHCVQLEGPVNLRDLKNELFNDYSQQIYFIYNGRKLTENAIIQEGTVRAYSRVLGGKGGFGSMLRAIGAQIEKTTNREACRDLSGRRLRDINEEKRLKNWIAQQAEREREAAERRQKKLERLCFEPKHDFSDQNYEKARTELTEKVHDAVEQGFRSASTSTSSNECKRKLEPQGGTQIKKKKSCLWVDDFDEDDISSDDSDLDGEEIQAKKNSVNIRHDTSLQNLHGEGSQVNEKKDMENTKDRFSPELYEDKLNPHEQGDRVINESHSNKKNSPSGSTEDTRSTDDAPQSDGDKSDVCSDSSTSERDSGVASIASC